MAAEVARIEPLAEMDCDRMQEISDEEWRSPARILVNKTEAVRIALENELKLLDDATVLRDRLRPLRETVSAYPDSGLAAEKAFFDELSGDC